MAFYVLDQPPDWTRRLADSLVQVRERLHPCPLCGSITDEDPCPVCRDPMRDRRTFCVMETAEDCLSLEQSGVYGGLYFVLGGRVSPLDGEEIPPGRLERLRERVAEEGILEVILATNPRIEGDLTSLTVIEALRGLTVRLTRLAYGLPVGGSIGFADRVTLHVALESRKDV
jgi:recombination protein RecR